MQFLQRLLATKRTLPYRKARDPNHLGKNVRDEFDIIARVHKPQLQNRRLLAVARPDRDVPIGSGPRKRPSLRERDTVHVRRRADLRRPYVWHDRPIEPPPKAARCVSHRDQPIKLLKKTIVHFDELVQAPRAQADLPRRHPQGREQNLFTSRAKGLRHGNVLRRWRDVSRHILGRGRTRAKNTTHRGGFSTHVLQTI